MHKTNNYFLEEPNIFKVVDLVCSDIIMLIRIMQLIMMRGILPLNSLVINMVINMINLIY